MKLLGMVSILLFLPVLAAILNVLLFYLSPFVSEVQRYFHDAFHQFMIKAGLMFIAFLMVIISILHESSSLSSSDDKVYASYVTNELCLFEEREERGKGSADGDDNEEFLMREEKHEVEEEQIYGVKDNDAYAKDDEDKRNESENNGDSGSNVNVEGLRLDEISEPLYSWENDDGCEGDAEDNGRSWEEDEDVKILKRRIEEFIGRSHRRWKEELLEETLNLLPIVNDSSYHLGNGRVREGRQRKVMPRISRPKDANNTSKRQRLHSIGRRIKKMQIEAKMIKMRSHSISKIRFSDMMNTCHTILPWVSSGRTRYE